MADPALGILLPIKRGKTGFFEQGFDTLTQVKSNLINLILTRKGERVYQPTFGSNLHSLVFAQMDQEYEQKVKQAVVSAVRTWMPFLRIQEQTVTRDDNRNSTLIEITFGLRSNTDITETIIVEF